MAEQDQGEEVSGLYNEYRGKPERGEPGRPHANGRRTP